MTIAPAPAKATIREVAAAAGVSLQTVSRVINDSPNVSAKARLAVEQAVAALGYAPSLAARRMGGSKSFLLLALNDRERTIETWERREGSDWVDQMLLGGMLTCARHGYRMMFELVDTHNDHIDRDLNAALAALRPDGVILTPPHSDNRTVVDILVSRDIRCARIGGFDDIGGTIIRMDDRAASAAAVEHLADLGHCRIGFIGGSAEYRLSAERRAGFVEAIERLGLDSDPNLVAAGNFGFASGQVAAAELLTRSEPPTAIIASSDQMALAVCAVAKERGLRIPDDLSVIGFDDTPMARMSEPSLTAISQPIAAMTACAAQLLIAPDPDAGDAVNPAHIIPFALVARDSTGPAPRG